MTILQDVTGNAGSEQGDLIAELAKLRAENDKLKAKAKARSMASLRLKVSEKGALSLYGMGKFPVTLYREQWAKLLDYQDEIREFITDHSDELKFKD